MRRSVLIEIDNALYGDQVGSQQNQVYSTTGSQTVPSAATVTQSSAAGVTSQYAQVMKKPKTSSDDDEGLTVIDNALYGSQGEETKSDSAGYEMATPVVDDGGDNESDNNDYDLTVVDNALYGQRLGEKM